MGFSSSVYHQMDDKYRIRMPVKYKAELDNDFVFVAGDQPCLSVYPRAAWDARVASMEAKVRESRGDPQMLRAMRRILRSAESDIKEDGQGRITISPVFREHLNIKKGDRELITLGMGDHIEIWKVSELDKYDNMTIGEAYTTVGFFG